jgi:hypothetical protein
VSNCRPTAVLENSLIIAALPSEVSRDLIAVNDADSADADICDQSLKPFTPDGLFAGQAWILVDKQDLILPPAERAQSISNVALIERAFSILEDLLRS